MGGTVGLVELGAIVSSTARICSSEITPWRTTRTVSPVASTIVEPSAASAKLRPTSPPSRYTLTELPSIFSALAIVVAGACPVRFADDTASGPISARSSSAKTLFGMRRATVPLVSPRSQRRVSRAATITVSAPGQKAVVSARTSSLTCSARASSVAMVGIKTGGGDCRPRPFASSSRCTAAGLNASAASP